MRTRTPRRLQRHHWRGGGVAVLALAAVIAVWVWGGFEWKDLVQTIAGFNAAAVFALMATLPIAGFSIMVVYLVAGVKFGPVLGGVVVAGATAVHLIASFWIARSVLRAPLQRFLQRRKHELPHVPEGEFVSIAAMAVLIPGLPYFARNYLLALTDIPFRIYFWVCLPLYVARSYVTILIGDLGTSPDRRTLLLLVGVYALKLSVCGYLIWRIRRRIRESKQGAITGTRAERPSP